jgi:hypothetical protein
VSEQDDLLRDVVLALRDTRAAYDSLLARCDEWTDSPDSGLDPDQNIAFDERNVVLEHLGQIRAGLDGLLRMAAAVKGKPGLASLVVGDPR